MPKQIIIAILANAGGVGKSTLAVHLAYTLAKQQISTCLLDLDPQHTLDIFLGLNRVEAEHSVVNLFRDEFDEHWHLKTVWEHLPALEICQGHLGMTDVSNFLASKRRGQYLLAKRLKTHPLKHQVVILDCPATLGIICENALSASTHLLIPVQLEVKSIHGAMELIRWCQIVSEELELNPYPEILGFVPSMYDKRKAIHRQYLEELPQLANPLNLKIYPTIRDSTEFKNATSQGVTLHQYRPGHPALKDFDRLTQDLTQLIT
jgi:chromosome partitioning protein